MKYLLIISVLIISCSVEKRAEKKGAWLIAHDKLGGICNLMYPPRPDSVVNKTDTITKVDTLQGDQVTIRDTLKCKDSIIYREVKCPPTKIITNTIHDSVIRYQDNPNLRAAYEQQLREKDKQIASKDDIVAKQQVKIDKNDWWKTACLITWFVVVLAIGVRLFVYKRPI